MTDILISTNKNFQNNICNLYLGDSEEPMFSQEIDENGYCLFQNVKDSGVLRIEIERNDNVYETMFFLNTEDLLYGKPFKIEITDEIILYDSGNLGLDKTGGYCFDNNFRYESDCLMLIGKSACHTKSKINLNHIKTFFIELENETEDQNDVTVIFISNDEELTREFKVVINGVSKLNMEELTGEYVLEIANNNDANVKIKKIWMKED